MFFAGSNIHKCFPNYSPSALQSTVVDIALITNYFLPAGETFPSPQSYQVDL